MAKILNTLLVDCEWKREGSTDKAVAKMMRIDSAFSLDNYLVIM